jgi:hypothetical protein
VTTGTHSFPGTEARPDAHIVNSETLADVSAAITIRRSGSMPMPRVGRRQTNANSFKAVESPTTSVARIEWATAGDANSVARGVANDAAPAMSRVFSGRAASLEPSGLPLLRGRSM